MNMVRCMLSQSSLSKIFWGEAVKTATYVLNSIPSRSLESTPYELWTSRKPTLSHLRMWGTVAQVLIPQKFREIRL